MHKQSSKKTPITAMQLAVGKALASGLTGKEVAQLLRISPRTVDAHRRLLYAKIGVHNAAQLTLWAVREGHIQVSPVLIDRRTLAAPHILAALENLLAAYRGTLMQASDDQFQAYRNAVVAVDIAKGGQ